MLQLETSPLKFEIIFYLFPWERCQRKPCLRRPESILGKSQNLKNPKKSFFAWVHTWYMWVHTILNPTIWAAAKTYVEARCQVGFCQEETASDKLLQREPTVALGGRLWREILVWKLISFVCICNSFLVSVCWSMPKRNLVLRPLLSVAKGGRGGCRNFVVTFTPRVEHEYAAFKFLHKLLKIWSKHAYSALNIHPALNGFQTFELLILKHSACDVLKLNIFWSLAQYSDNNLAIFW